MTVEAADNSNKETEVIEEKGIPATTGTEPATARPSGGVEATAREAAAVARDRADELRDAARSTLSDARDAVEKRSEAAKGQAADEIERTAAGLEAAADEMEGSRLQQELLREAADGLKQISRAVAGKSVGQMVEDLSEFGRRNPLAYMGGAALAGFALARFARAAAPVPETGDYARPEAARPEVSRPEVASPGYAAGTPNTTLGGELDV
jgi:ElaB/YqjD/DUF883 family membrane-anchored ribosome-binding protein